MQLREMYKNVCARRSVESEIRKYVKNGELAAWLAKRVFNP